MNKRKSERFLDILQEAAGDYSIAEALPKSEQAKELRRARLLPLAACASLAIVTAVCFVLNPFPKKDAAVTPGADVYDTETVAGTVADTDATETEPAVITEPYKFDVVMDINPWDSYFTMDWTNGPIVATFTIYPDNHAELTSLTDNAVGVVIPRTVDGVPVTAIADGAINDEKPIRIFAREGTADIARSYAVEHGHIFIEESIHHNDGTHGGYPDHYYPDSIKRLDWYERDTSSDDFIVSDDNARITELVNGFLADKAAGTCAAGGENYDLAYGEGYDELVTRVFYRMMCASAVDCWNDGYSPRYIYDETLTKESCLYTDFDRYIAYYIEDVVIASENDSETFVKAFARGVGTETVSGTMKTADDFYDYFSKYDPDFVKYGRHDYDLSHAAGGSYFSNHNSSGYYKIFGDPYVEYRQVREEYNAYLGKEDYPVDYGSDVPFIAFPIVNITEDEIQIAFCTRNADDLADTIANNIRLRDLEYEFMLKKNGDDWGTVRSVVTFFEVDENGITSTGSVGLHIPPFAEPLKEACIAMMEAQGIR